MKNKAVKAELVAVLEAALKNAKLSQPPDSDSVAYEGKLGKFVEDDIFWNQLAQKNLKAANALLNKLADL